MDRSSFRVQPQVIMGSSIVEYYGKTVSRSSRSQTPGSARTSREVSLAGKVHKSVKLID